MTQFIKDVSSKLSKVAVRHILAFVITIGCYGLIYVFTITAIPDSNKDVVLMAVGYIFAQMGNVGSYFFGSSKNEEKTGE